MKSQERKILVVGATGMLGSSIVEALLAQGTKVRALLRPGKAEVEESLKKAGLEVTHGDVLQPETLGSAMEGIQVVVSALHNDPDTFVIGHRNLIEAAEKAGVERFIPSDFAVDFFKIEAEENFNLAMRKQVAPLFETTRLRPIHILIGAFLDTMLDRRAPFIDWERKILPYYGDGNQLCDFTSVRDTGRYVAQACLDADAPEVLRFAGATLTMPQLAESIGQLSSEKVGEVEELPALISSKKHTASHPFEWIALQYHHNMVSGRAKLEPLDNARYPQVVPETVEEFSRRFVQAKGSL